MPDDNQRVDGEKPQHDAIAGGGGVKTAIDVGAQNKDTIDRISKAERWKSYLDTRKQYVECEFRTSQDFDKIMLTWPAALIAGSLTIFWHINDTVFWMSFLYAGWFFEFMALALMLGSMITRQMLYRHLIANHDESYQAYLDSEVNVPPDDPWKQKTQLAEWCSIVAMILGAIFIFAFSISNAPSSIDPPTPASTNAPHSKTSEPTHSMLTEPETTQPVVTQPVVTQPVTTQPSATQPASTESGPAKTVP